MQALISQSFTLQPLSRAEKATLAEQLAAGLPDAAEISVLRSQLFRQAEAAINAQNMSEILRWLEDMMRLLERFDDAKSSGTVEAWFSPKADCPGRIRSFLAQAKSTVDICVFTITDDRLTSAVLEAHARGVEIRIITDNDKAADLGSDAERFLQAGVQLRVDRTPYHMHHKFAIADRNLLLNGSYNWTRGAAESNEENFVQIADALTKQGISIWDFHSAFRLHSPWVISGDGHLSTKGHQEVAKLLSSERTSAMFLIRPVGLAVVERVKLVTSTDAS
jgi:phosphatidylserine/phosphatidylglycerophosphate/cardiolipin synthase-like enzyme